MQELEISRYPTAHGTMCSFGNYNTARTAGYSSLGEPMIYLSEGLTIRLDTFGTAICSTFSLIGSLIVILSFLLVKSVGTKPRGAQIIFNLACADCIWFTSSLIQSLFWTFEGSYGEPGKVPIALCFILSPLVTVSRMSSLMWTCVIAHEAVQSVYQRKYNLKGSNTTTTSTTTTTSPTTPSSKTSSSSSSLLSTLYEDYKYFLFVYTISLPGGILAIAKQHSVNHGFGCEPDYEKLGEWYEIMFTELIPIICGFLFNIFAFFQVRSKMSTRAFPRSVRKRRKRVMYHYLIVCIICWIPTIVFYTLEIFGFHSAFLEVFSRVCLYTTGFFNCLVFGMQDPHISRAFKRVLQYFGLGCLVGITAETNLQRNAVEKTVMFENAEKTNADIAKDKKTVYRYHRLSREDKAELYRLRPDLNIKGRDSLGSQESESSSSMRSSSSSYHEPLLLHQTMTQMERERSIQAQAKRDRVRQLSEHISLSESNDESGSHQNYRALKNIDGKILRKPETTRNSYYDSDLSQRPTNSTSDGLDVDDLEVSAQGTSRLILFVYSSFILFR